MSTKFYIQRYYGNRHAHHVHYRRRCGWDCSTVRDGGRRHYYYYYNNNYRGCGGSGGLAHTSGACIARGQWKCVRNGLRKRTDMGPGRGVGGTVTRTHTRSETGGRAHSHGRDDAPQPPPPENAGRRAPPSCHRSSGPSVDNARRRITPTTTTRISAPRATLPVRARERRQRFASRPRACPALPSAGGAPPLPPPPPTPPRVWRSIIFNY